MRSDSNNIDFLVIIPVYLVMVGTGIIVIASGAEPITQEGRPPPLFFGGWGRRGPWVPQQTMNYVPNS